MKQKRLCSIFLLLAVFLLACSTSYAEAAKVKPRKNIDLFDMVAQSVLVEFYTGANVSDVENGYTYAAKLENGVWSDFILAPEEGTGKIYGYGNEKYGTPVTFRFKAEPAFGFRFDHWTEYDNGDSHRLDWDAIHDEVIEAGTPNRKFYAFFEPLDGATQQTFTDESADFVAWYYMDGSTKRYLSLSQSFTTMVPAGVSVLAEHGVSQEEGNYLVKVGGLVRGYDDIQSALDFAAGWRDAIVMVNADVTISGTVTVPANVTLLVPGESEECYYDTPAAENVKDINTYGYLALYNNGNPPYNNGIAPFRTLTLASGAILNIDGRMSVSSKVMAAEGGTFLTSGSPIEKYGNVVLSAGSKVNVNDGGRLYVWGFMTGEGAVEAFDGAHIHEAFQFADMASKDQLVALLSAISMGIFPFSQYGIQNIESRVTFHYGSANIVTSYMSLLNNVINTGNITFVASANDENAGMFILNDASASLVRHYDGQRNKQCYTVHGNASIGGVRLMLGVFDMSAIVSSADYTLPLTNNLDITLAPGSKLSTDVYVCLFPGCKVSVEQGAELEIAKNGSITVYDINDSYKVNEDGNVYGWIADGFNYMPLTYVPGRDYVYAQGTPYEFPITAQMLLITMGEDGVNMGLAEQRLGIAIMSLPDAEIDVNGTLTTYGPLLNTQSGANVHSSAQSGVVNLNYEKLIYDELAMETLATRTELSLKTEPATMNSLRFVHYDQFEGNNEIETIDHYLVRVPSMITCLKNQDGSYFYDLTSTVLARAMRLGELPIVLRATNVGGTWQMQTFDLTSYDADGNVSYFNPDEFQQARTTSDDNLVAILNSKDDYNSLTDEQKVNVIFPGDDDYYICSSLVLTDKKDFALPYDDEAGVVVDMVQAPVTYSRTLYNGFNTTTLPFDLSLSDLPDGCQILTIANYDEDANVLTLQENTSLLAGTPCLIWLPSSTSAYLLEKETQVSSYAPDTDDSECTTGAGLFGGFTRLAIHSDHAYVIDNSGVKLAPVGTNEEDKWVHAFRAFVVVNTPAMAAAAPRVVVPNSLPTDMEEQVAPVARKVLSEGRVLIRRGGQLYGVDGVLVR